MHIGAFTREARWCVYTRSALVRLHEKRVGASTREARWCVYTRSALVRLHEKLDCIGVSNGNQLGNRLKLYVYTQL